MLKKIIYKISSCIFGIKAFQSFFQSLNEISLIGMNIGGGGDLRSSGENNVLKYIKKCYNKNSNIIILDVGANVGIYTLSLKKVFNDDATIHAIEPSKKTFLKLIKNLKGITKVKCHNFGISNINTNILLYTNSDESALASVYKRNLDHFNIKMNMSEEVEMIKIDDFCIANKIKHIHFLKLDVEGHELNVLEGAKKMISSSKIDFIQFEFGGCNIDSKTFFQQFYYLLNDKYKIYRIVKDGIYLIDQYNERLETFITTNYLAERRLI